MGRPNPSASPSRRCTGDRAAVLGVLASVWCRRTRIAMRHTALHRVVAWCAVSMLAAAASAQQPTLSVRQRLGAPPGFVANVLTVDTDGADLTNYSLALESLGSLVINDVVSGLGDVDNMRLNAFALGLFPEYDFDSYVQFGPKPASLVATFGSTGHPRFGDPVVIDDSNFLVSAFNTDSNDIGVIDIAQIVLSDQVNGDLYYGLFFGSAINVQTFVPGGIVNGVLQGPQTTVSTWQSAGGGNWDDPANWTVQVPNGQDLQAVFSSQGPTGDATIQLNNPITVGGITVTTGHELAIAGPNTLTFDAQGRAAQVIVSGDNALIIDADVVLKNNDLEVTVASQSTLQLNGTLANTPGRLSIKGGGTFELNSASGHTGGTLVERAGGLSETIVLRVTAQGSLVGTGDVTVTSDDIRPIRPSTLELVRAAGSDPARHSVSPGSVVLRRNGVLRIAADLDVSNFLSATSGGVGSGIHLDQVTFSGGGTNVLDFSALPGGDELRLGASRDSTIASAVVLVPDAATDTLRFGGGAARLTVDAVLADAGATSTHVEHATGTTRLAGANTFTGLTTVRSGVLEVNHDQALGTISAGTTVQRDGTLGINAISPEPITVEGSGTRRGTVNINQAGPASGDLISKGGTVSLPSGAGSFGGAITMNSGALTLDDIVTGLITVGRFGATAQINKAGPASGDLSIQGGTVTLAAGAGSYGGAMGIGGGTLDLNDIVAGRLSIAGGVARVNAADAASGDIDVSGGRVGTERSHRDLWRTDRGQRREPECRRQWARIGYRGRRRDLGTRWRLRVAD